MAARWVAGVRPPGCPQSPQPSGHWHRRHHHPRYYFIIIISFSFHTHHHHPRYYFILIFIITIVIIIDRPPVCSSAIESLASRERSLRMALSWHQVINLNIGDPDSRLVLSKIWLDKYRSNIVTDPLQIHISKLFSSEVLFVTPAPPEVKDHIITIVVTMIMMTYRSQRSLS